MASRPAALAAATDELALGERYPGSHRGERSSPMRSGGPALVVVLLAVAVAPLNGQGPDGQASMTALPVRYAADRFYVTPVTTRGDTLLLYTDTGGGACMLSANAVRRLGSQTETMVAGTDTVSLARLPALSPAASIPLPQAGAPIADRFLVPPEAVSSQFSGDGFLGRTWFAARTWVFDYPAHALAILTGPAPTILGAPDHVVPLGFQTNSAGQRTMNFARIRVEVDGDSLDLLFDTGATVTLTDSALAQLGDSEPAERGTSFIAQGVFERWHRRHPDWRVLEGGGRFGPGTMPLIRVPQVSVGGWTVGPVWFTMRPDRNFHQYMSQWMDRQVEGALGGSALKYFRVTLDYPDAVARFERP